MIKKIFFLRIISLQFFFVNLMTSLMASVSFLETQQSERDLLSQYQQSENVISSLTSNDIDSAMCDLSASLKVTNFTSTWECSNGIPTTDPCNEVTTFYNYYSYTTFSWIGVTCENGNVTEIALDGYGLTGTISSSIGLLTSLTYLSLGINNIIGSIPSSIGYLHSLTYLNLGTNSLTGTIPSQLGSLTNLIELYLDTNKFTGTIPASLCDTTTLSSFHVYNVSLSCYSSCLISVSGKDFGNLASCTDIPTSAPSSSTPVPTALPTSLPTSIPTVIPSSRVPTTTPTSAPIVEGCPITIRLYDKYGDGWNDAFLSTTNTNYLTGYGVLSTNGTPTSTVNGYTPDIDQYMSTLSLLIGKGKVAALSIKSLEPIKSIKEWWEIEWSYYLRGKTYRGGVDTILSLSCTWESLSEYNINVIESKKLLLADTCKSCIDKNKGSSASPEKMKISPRDLLGIPRVSPTTMVTTFDQLPITLYTEDGSLYYSISDSNRVKLFAGKSYCELSREEECEESLADGQYIFRVSGSGGSSDASGNTWKFCGLKGGVPSEVFFRWKQGKCTVLQSVSDSIFSDMSINKKDNEEDSMLPLMSSLRSITSRWGLTLLVGITAIGVVMIGVLGLRMYFPSIATKDIDNSSRSTIALFTYPFSNDNSILVDASMSNCRDIEK